MPVIQPIPSINFTPRSDRDVSSYIAPPYDVLGEADKQQLLQTEPHNVVGIDLPHLPAKTAGPDEVYERAADTYRQWLEDGLLARRSRPAVFVYRQSYRASVGGSEREFKRLGLFANVGVQPFGRSASGGGGVLPHEQTFSGPKEDRMKLMAATRAQLSPIFGLYSDPEAAMQPLLEGVVGGREADYRGRTGHDGVLHELWAVDDPQQITMITSQLADRDIFIADGHHRYTTALNYRQRLIDAGQAGVGAGAHPADYCMFVLVAMQDPGMIVLPTHRVLGAMARFTMQVFIQESNGKLRVVPFSGGDLAALEAALPGAGPHAMGLYDPANPQQPLWIATTVDDDPLAGSHHDHSSAWRMLDVAVLQHLIVEGICAPAFAPGGGQVAWKFPHSLEELKADADAQGFQLGVVMQPTPLDSVRQVSEAGELMPQKSTFFYPKLATGLVINPLE